MCGGQALNGLLDARGVAVVTHPDPHGRMLHGGVLGIAVSVGGVNGDVLPKESRLQPAHMRMRWVRMNMDSSLIAHIFPITRGEETCFFFTSIVMRSPNRGQPACDWQKRSGNSTSGQKRFRNCVMAQEVTKSRAFENARSAATNAAGCLVIFLELSSSGRDPLEKLGEGRPLFPA